MKLFEIINHDLLSNITVTEMLSDGDVCEWVSDYVEGLMTEMDMDSDDDYTDKEGNEYKIEAKKGNIDKANPDIIYLENVKAVILLQNSDFISIESTFAKYNTKNFDTLFKDSVSVDYGEHALRSKFLDLSFEKNLVSIYDSVQYLSGISSLSADKAEIDILNKKTKIFMNNPKNKVQIKNITNNGNN